MQPSHLVVAVVVEFVGALFSKLDFWMIGVDGLDYFCISGLLHSSASILWMIHNFVLGNDHPMFEMPLPDGLPSSWGLKLSMATCEAFEFQFCFPLLRTSCHQMLWRLGCCTCGFRIWLGYMAGWLRAISVVSTPLQSEPDRDS